MGLECIVTKQEAFVFSCVFSFYFLLFEKKKKGKRKFKGKSAKMHFRSNLCLQSLWRKLGNKEGRYRSGLNISDIWVMVEHRKKGKKVLEKLKWRLWLWRRWGLWFPFIFFCLGLNYSWMLRRYNEATGFSWSNLELFLSFEKNKIRKRKRRYFVL